MGGRLWPNDSTCPNRSAAYFAADKRDIEAIAQCFTKDAVGEG